MTSTALFYINKNGRKSDIGLHDDQPANPRAYHDANVKRAIARGVSPEDAMRRYGYEEPVKVTPAK